MWVKRHKRYFEIDLIKTQSESWFNTTVDSGNSKRLNSKQSLISKHFW